MDTNKNSSNYNSDENILHTRDNNIDDTLIINNIEPLSRKYNSTDQVKQTFLLPRSRSRSIVFSPSQSRSSSVEYVYDQNSKMNQLKTNKKQQPPLSKMRVLSRKNSISSFSEEHSSSHPSLLCSLKPDQNIDSSDDDNIINQIFDDPVDNIFINKNKTSDLQTKLLEDYIDRCYIMTIMCDQSSNYYTRLKYLFQVPIIISSSTMTIVNSNNNINENHIVNIFNIAINVLITVLIALQSTFLIRFK